MKTALKIAILVLTMSTLTVCADDIHLVQTTFHDETPATNAIYVLLLPLHDSGQVHINPVVMKKFDGKEIGKIMKGAVNTGFLPRGNVLHVDPNPLMVPPPAAEVKALKAYCKKIGINVVVSLTQ